MRICQNRLFIQVYFPFLIFIVIPILLLNSAAFQLLQGIRERDYRENLSQTEAVGGLLSATLQASVSLSRKLTIDNDLQKLAYLEVQKDTADYAQLRAVDAVFQKYTAAKGEDYSLHIFYNGNAILLSTDGSCSDFSYFYKKSYQFGDYSLDDLKRIADAADYAPQFYPHQSFLINGISYDGFFYTSALNKPVSSRQSKGLILSVIRQELTDRLFRPLLQNGGFCYLTDRSGRLLNVSGTADCEIRTYLPTDASGYLPGDIYGSRYMVSYVCLPEGINLYAVKPASTIVANTRLLLFMVLGLDAACIVICTLAVIPIAKRRMRKLQKAFSMLDLSHEEQNRDYYDRLNQGIAALLDKNHQLSANLSHDIFLLRYEFWNKLLRGSFSGETELYQLAASSDIDLESDYFGLLLLAVKREGDPFVFSAGEHLEEEPVRLYREELTDHIESLMALHGYVYNMSVQQIVLLLRVSEAEKLDYCQLAEKLLDSLPAAPQGIAVRCAGSRLFSSPMSAGDEFAYCNNILLQYSDILSETSPAIIWSPKEYERCDSLYFPKKIYDQMTASIQAGERQKAADCLKEILRCNFSSSHPITPEMSTVLITRLKLIMMEAYREEMGFDLYKALKQIDALPSDAAKISVFIELTDKLCVYYQENLHQKTEKLRRKMTQYIDEQFTSPSFSLTEAASHCGFSDSYFSVLFREIMQENFSTYVDRLKMTLADRLIRETDLKIDEVARRVGYSDTNAFRRSYKKRFSISPSQRRSQQNS